MKQWFMNAPWFESEFEIDHHTRDHIPFAAVITKAALSPQLFKDAVYWSGRGLNRRPFPLGRWALIQPVNWLPGYIWGPNPDLQR